MDVEQIVGVIFVAVGTLSPIGSLEAMLRQIAPRGGPISLSAFRQQVTRDQAFQLLLCLAIIAAGMFLAFLARFFPNNGDWTGLPFSLS